jgi:hypothetical protein
VYQVSARSTDTICRIQKIIYLLCRLLPTDTTDGFSKIKKSEFISRPVGPRSRPRSRAHRRRAGVEDNPRCPICRRCPPTCRVAGAGGDESTSRRRRSCSTRTRSALRVVPCREEALEPAHEERGNDERATVGGADGGGKK